MKIRSQNTRMYLEFGEAYIPPHDERSAIYVNTNYSKVPVLAGLYENEERAKAVLYEIGLAFKNDKRVFYMPLA